MRALVRGAAFLFGVSLGLAGCGPRDTGYVEIRTVPVTAAVSVPLYLDSVRLAPVKNGSAILREPIGTARLAAETGSANRTVLCEIEVRKNRITTITLSVLERPPRCQCRTSGVPDGSGSVPCIG
jgi:hypothetical protein